MAKLPILEVTNKDGVLTAVIYGVTHQVKMADDQKSTSNKSRNSSQAS